MTKWMVTDMTHSNALITNAMLASYASEQNITYIQMIEPFIIYSLPHKVGKEIDVSKVAENVYNEFGLDIKSKVVERVLLNLSKKRGNKKVTYKKQKNKYNFFVNQLIDHAEFDKKRNYMKNLVADVVNLLKEFINNEENIIIKIDSQKAQENLINFLDKYNATAYKNINNVEKIQINETITSDNYKVAMFILNEYKKELGCFDKIRTIQEGYFASKALYNFFENFENNKETSNQRMKNTLIVLDTMLIVDALRLDTEYKANSMEELLTLIKDNGGSLYTFDYYIEELCGIIDKYAIDPNSRISLDLDFFRRNNINFSQVLLFSQNIKKQAEELSSIKLPYSDMKISVLDSISYDSLIENQTWHINRKDLEEEIRKKIEYANISSFENDCDSIERILYEKICNKNKYIFLSSNHMLIFAAKEFAEKDDKHLFYTDIDLTSMIWLSNYNSKSKLSELKLLQNAYAALTPSKEILDEVVNMIEQNMNSTDEQLKSDALLLRFDPDLLDHISQVYQNNKNNLELKSQNDLMEKLRNKIASEMKIAIESDMEKVFNEKKQKLDEEQQKVIKLKKKNEAKEKSLNKKESALEDREDHVNSIKAKAKDTNAELDSTNKKLNRIYDSEKEKLKGISIFAEKIACLVLFLICGTAMFFILTPFIYFCLKNLIKDNAINNIYQIDNLIAFIITLISLIPIYFKFVKKISRKIQEYIYHMLCRRSKILND